MPKRKAPDDVKHFKRLHNELMEAAKRLDNGLLLIDEHLGATRTKHERMLLEAMKEEVATVRRRTLDTILLLYMEGDRARRRR